MRRNPSFDSANTLKAAMFGGSRGSFFNALVREGTLLVDGLDIVAVVASGNPEKADREGKFTPYEWICTDSADLIAGKPEHGAEIVFIETPNSTHFPIGRAVVGDFYVSSDKPSAHTWDDAQEMAGWQEQKPTHCMYTYEGRTTHRMLRRIVRHLLQSGRRLRGVRATYDQHWLESRLEDMSGQGGHQQAAGRTNPAVVGPFCAGLDLGTHCLRGIQSCTGHRVAEVEYAKVWSHVDGRTMDDHLLLHGVLDNSDRTHVVVEPHQCTWNGGARNDFVLQFDFDGLHLTLDHRNPDRITASIGRCGSEIQLYRGENHTGVPHIGEVFEQDMDDANGIWGGDPHPPGHEPGYTHYIAAQLRAWLEDIKLHRESAAVPSPDDVWYPTLFHAAEDWAVIEACRRGLTGDGFDGEGFPVAVPEVSFGLNGLA